MPTLEQIPLKAWQELFAKLPAGGRVLGWLLHLDGFIRNLSERDPFTFSNGGRAVQTNPTTTFLEESDVTNAELSYLEGVTSAIQGQLDAKPDLDDNNVWTGTFTHQNTVDSTAAFRILDSDGGTPVINVDTTNERVGIGTASPAERLHVGGDVRVDGLTASKAVFTDANKTLISKDISPCDVVRTYIVPTTQTVTTGTLTSGTVSDVQVWADGNSVNVSEVTGVPGFDVRYTFASVAEFCELAVSAYYAAVSASHYAEYQIYDDTNTTWRTLFTFVPGLGLNYRFAAFPDITNMSNYINGSDEVITRFYHPASGAAAHNLYVGYAAIVGATT